MTQAHAALVRINSHSRLPLDRSPNYGNSLALAGGPWISTEAFERYFRQERALPTATIVRELTGGRTEIETAPATRPVRERAVVQSLVDGFAIEARPVVTNAGVLGAVEFPAPCPSRAIGAPPKRPLS